MEEKKVKWNQQTMEYMHLYVFDAKLNISNKNSEVLTGSQNETE